MQQIQRTFRESGQTRISKEKKRESSNNKTSNTQKTTKNSKNDFISPGKSKKMEVFENLKLSSYFY